LKTWFQLRQQGIKEGRARALAAGIGGMRVCFAPEFNIPYVAFDYVSYSSYQSMGDGDPR